MLLLFRTVDQDFGDGGRAGVRLIPDLGRGGEQSGALVAIEAFGQGVLVHIDGFGTRLRGADRGALALVHAGEEGDLALSDVGEREGAEGDLLPVAVPLLDAAGVRVTDRRAQEDLKVVSEVSVQLVEVGRAEVLARGSARAKEVGERRFVGAQRGRI